MADAVENTMKPLSDLMDLTHPDGGPTGEAIFLMQEKLYGYASFARLHKGTKKAANKGVRKQKTISFGSNYGVYPEGELVILDIDVKDATSADHARTLRENQLDVLEKFFHVALRETFTVITPTGGVHCYLLLPHDFSFADDAPDFPKTSLGGNMSGMINTLVSGHYPDHIRRKLSVDIRRPDVNTYVLGPGSWTVAAKEKNAGKYNFAYDIHGFSSQHIDAPILRIPDIGKQNMQQLSRDIQQKRIEKYYKKQRQDAMQQSDGTNLQKSYPANRHIKSLRTLVKKHKRYHSKRAAVKSALACCYTNEVIAEVCVELGINKDTSKKYSLSYETTLHDIEGFVVDKPYHSIYCYHTTKHIKNTDTTTGDGMQPIAREELQKVLYAQSEAMLLKKKQFLEDGAPRRTVNPAVLDMQKVHTSLMQTTNRAVMPQRVRDAFDILDYYIQPLTNYGVEQIILSRTEVQKTLSITDTRVTEATRLLRDVEILHIDIPPQPGRTTVYTVNTSFFHDDLTWALKKTWGYNNARREAFNIVHPAALYFDRMTQDFREVFTGERVVSPNRTVQRVLQKTSNIANHAVRETTGAGAALRYIRTEAEKHGVDVVPADETTYIVIEKATGQIIVEDWNTEKVVDSMTLTEYVDRTGYAPEKKYQKRSSDPRDVLTDDMAQRSYATYTAQNDHPIHATFTQEIENSPQFNASINAPKVFTQEDSEEIMSTEKNMEQEETLARDEEKSVAEQIKDQEQEYYEKLAEVHPEPPADAGDDAWENYHRITQRERALIRRTIAKRQVQNMSYAEMFAAVNQG